MTTQQLPAKEAQAQYSADKRKLVALAIAAARRAWQMRDMQTLAGTLGALQFLLANRSLQALVEGLDEQGIEAPARHEVIPSSLGGISMLGMPMVDRLGFANTESQLIRATLTEMADTGRAATQLGIAVRPSLEGYIRYLNPPSCARCAILAGKVYRWSTGFDRHDNCDCEMVPVSDMSEVPDSALFSAEEAFESGQIGTWRYKRDENGKPIPGTKRWEPGLSKADAQAVRDGASMSSVVNVRQRAQGLVVAGYHNTPEVMTRPGTKNERRYDGYRDKWMPSAIYRMAKGDRDEALRLLLRFGYVR